MSKYTIRPTTRADLPALQTVLDGTELFPSAMLPDMIDPHLVGESEAVWLTCEGGGAPIGLCFATPETFTEGTWNMLALGVLPARQGKGAGTALVVALEERLRAEGQRILIADTSGAPAFERTRAFYRRNGYEEEARIRDFWAAGDDKVTFRRAL